jgi:hypothetical protein
MSFDELEPAKRTNRKIVVQRVPGNFSDITALAADVRFQGTKPTCRSGRNSCAFDAIRKVRSGETSIQGIPTLF